jgi:hypothetical protein
MTKYRVTATVRMTVTGEVEAASSADAIIAFNKLRPDQLILHGKYPIKRNQASSVITQEEFDRQKQETVDKLMGKPKPPAEEEE